MRGGSGRDGDDVVEVRPFERDQDRHQLRQARDGELAMDPVAEQDLARVAVLDQVGMRVYSRNRRLRCGRKQQRRGEDGQAALHGRTI